MGVDMTIKMSMKIEKCFAAIWKRLWKRYFPIIMEKIILVDESGVDGHDHVQQRMSDTHQLHFAARIYACDESPYCR